MNGFVVVTLIATIVSGVRGGCFGGLRAPLPGSKNCMYEGNYLANGESKELLNVCLKCTCETGFLTCCDLGMVITDYPSDCKVVPDGPCHQKAVQIDDESKPCKGPIGGKGR